VVLCHRRDCRYRVTANYEIVCIREIPFRRGNSRGLFVGVSTPDRQFEAVGGAGAHCQTPICAGGPWAAQTHRPDELHRAAAEAVHDAVAQGEGSGHAEISHSGPPMLEHFYTEWRFPSRAR
jgi:hypothetical protein